MRRRSAALGRVDKAHPAMDGGKLDEAKEAFGGLVVARRDAAKLLQQTHHALDAVAPGLAAMIERARVLRFDFHGMLGRAPRKHSSARRASAPASFVGEKFPRAGLAKRDQLRRGGGVGGLAGRQMQGQRHAICVGRGVDLGRDPAAE